MELITSLIKSEKISLTGGRYGSKEEVLSDEGSELSQEANAYFRLVRMSRHMHANCH